MSMKMFPQALRLRSFILLSLVVTCGLAGCKSYQLGSSTELPFKTIFVKPVSNDSFAPQAQIILSSQLRDAFIRDGRLQLVTEEDIADAVLLVNLTDYERTAASRKRGDSVVAKDFDLQLTADVSLFNQNKGDYYFEAREITERSNAYVENPYIDPSDTQTQDLLQAEHQALPRITRDLAGKIADEVLSPWEPR